MLNTRTPTFELLPFDWSSDTDRVAEPPEELGGTNTEQQAIVELLQKFARDFQTRELIEDSYQGQSLPSDTTFQYDSAPSTRYASITRQLLMAIRNEEFEFGVISNAETIIEKQLAENSLETRNWINDIFVRYYCDTKILTGILHIISRFQEFEMHPQGLTMALAALVHKDDEVKELGVRAFEHWASENSLAVLKHVQVGTPWLQQYIDEVVEDLSLEHGISGTQVCA